MPVTHAQDTFTGHWYKSSGNRNLYVCRSILYKFFLVPASCTQQNTALFQRRNCLAHDTNRATWLAGELFWCRNCGELATNFSCKFLVQVSWTCITGIGDMPRNV